MMMPANYSVIAENEMTYVVGGGLVEWLGERTPVLWNAANTKTLTTNIVTLVGNKFVKNTVNNTVGYVFSGNATWAGLGNNLKALFVAKNGEVGDSVAQTLGTIAAVYNLGNATVANTAGSVKLSYGETAGWNKAEKTVDANGNVSYKYTWG